MYTHYICAYICAHYIYMYTVYKVAKSREVAKAGSVVGRFYGFHCQPRVPERAEAAVAAAGSEPSRASPGPARAAAAAAGTPGPAQPGPAPPVTYHLHGALGAPAGSAPLRHRRRPSGRSGRNNHRDGGRSGRKRRQPSSSSGSGPSSSPGSGPGP